MVSPSWIARTAVVVASLLSPARTMAVSDDRDPGERFTREILPIFQARCLDCHGPTRPRGGLRLDALESTLRGGGSGPVIEPGRASDSPLIHHVAGLEDASRMPPKGEPVTSEQIDQIRAWIDQLQLTDFERLAIDNASDTPSPPWPWTPLERPDPPAIEPGRASWVRNPIDAFILRTLLDRGLNPAAEADRRTLLRRLSLDLTGLPPTPEELTAFKHDPAPDAYDRQVDRLLASPRYGERWARRWLDVVHYADSHGQDQDRPRPNAWPYRDYLIRSFNADKPYARLVREQVAGDVLFPDDPDAIVATGFLAAGPWDESGLMGIAEQSIDRQIAHYLDRDDIVTSTMSTFAAVTVGCARCHDHKFDPIAQEDYYALQAVFAGIDKADRTYDSDPTTARRRADLARREAEARAASSTDPGSVLLSPEHQSRSEAFESAHREAESRWSIPEPIACRSDKGSRLRPLLDRSILSIGARPDADTYTVSLAIDAPTITGLRLEVLADDTLPQGGPGRNDNGNLHLSEIRIFARAIGTDGPGEPVRLRAATADFNQDGWGVDRARDGDPATAWGIFPAVGASHRAVFTFEDPVGFPGGTELTVHLDQLHGGGHLIGRFRLATTAASDPLDDRSTPLPDDIARLIAVPAALRTPSRRAELARLVWLREIERERATLPPLARVYCGTNRFEADGTFRPAQTPRPVFVLTRGEVMTPGARAEPGALKAVAALPSRFKLEDPDDEGSRRAALANWLTDRANPLTWRAIANRAWHDHFGRGLVDTPNDLGAMGGRPSHPELLDWLAAEIRDGTGSLKDLHRKIVTSSSYRQSTRHDPDSSTIDAENRLLWRFNRLRLDAESVRDSILQAAGRLDLTMYGPPAMQFRLSPGVHITPVADYNDLDLDRPEARRRAVYRFIFRTRPDPFLQALDCPDASQSSPARTESLGPLQALALWNNRLVLHGAQHLADRASRSASTVDAQVEFISLQILGRRPNDDERAAWSDHAARHGLANLARILFNSNEFLFID
jgi:hypothetical protein